jgi:hypothetical protein
MFFTASSTKHCYYSEPGDGNPEINSPFGNPRHIREDNEAYVKAAGSEDVDWMQLAKVKFQWRILLRTVLALRFYSYKMGNMLTHLSNLSLLSMD